MTDKMQVEGNHATIAAEARSTGDAAVEGLLAGFAAGVFMALYLVLTGLVSGSAPAQTLARFNPGSSDSPLSGALMHMAVSGVYGALYGILYQNILRHLFRNRVPGWLAGAAYGIVLFVFATIVLLPGNNSPLREIPALQFGIAHLLYGLVLGALTDRALNKRNIVPVSDRLV